MKIAIMQPYIYPYIGYFQLIKSVDKFVILDDVNYINKGWINRNNILVNGKSNLFTIPLKEASQNKKISEILISDDANWETKFLKTVLLSYKKAPFFEIVYPILEEITNSSKTNISKFNLHAIERICQYLEINTRIVPSSSIYKNDYLKAQDKIIDICIQENASIYINPIGGVELYNKQDFIDKKLELFFIKSKNILYKQFSNEFVPWLSIIDVLMFNSKEEVAGLLNQYELI
jgi:hypothetical protein